MSDINTGGPAFPCLEAAMTGISSDGEERWETEPHGGMTLRDYFAAKAMAAILAGRNMDKNGFLHCDVAEDAYAYADAILKARAV